MPERDWQSKEIDVAILEYMAEQCPIGQEVEFVLGLHRLGFYGSVPAYRDAVLKGLAKRFERDYEASQVVELLGLDVNQLGEKRYASA